MLLPGQPSISWPPTVTPRWTKTSTAEPLAVDLDTVKDFINRPREDTFFDAQIAGFIRVAQKAIENACKEFSIVPTTWVGTIPAFYHQIRINRRPFLSVDKIEYVAPDTGTITTVDTSVYQALPIAQKCGMVFLGDSQDWPVPAVRFDAVRISVTAGLDPIDDDMLHALLMTIAALDRARGDEQSNTGANISVYAMKNARGASLVPAEARALLSDYIFRTV